jgi:hypothetical protein
LGKIFYLFLVVSKLNLELKLEFEIRPSIIEIRKIEIRSSIISYPQNFL